MKRNLLLAYHVMTGFSDTVTGILLVVAPQLTLHLMHLHASREALPFLSFIGVFVLSVGLACMRRMRQATGNRMAAHCHHPRHRGGLRYRKRIRWRS